MPLATRVVDNNAQVLVSSRQSCGTMECTKQTSVYKQDVFNKRKQKTDNYTNKINQENLELQNTEQGVRMQGKSVDVKHDCRHRGIKYKRKKKLPSEVAGVQTACADSYNSSHGAALKQFIMVK